MLICILFAAYKLTFCSVLLDKALCNLTSWTWNHQVPPTKSTRRHWP